MNTLIAGTTGSGCTVSLKHYAEHALQSGHRVELISVKENWVALTAKGAKGTTASEQDYVDALLEVSPGDSDKPLFLGLDNFDYVMQSQFFGVVVTHLLKLLTDAHTHVAARVQCPRGEVFNAISPYFNRRILMGRSTTRDQLAVLGQTYDPFVTPPLGTGVILMEDGLPTPLIIADGHR